ncbi:MAG: hypothetical protein WBV53_12375 [Solirubrobacterales bacterium]
MSRLVPGFVLLALLLAGCGGGSDSTTGTQSKEASVTATTGTATTAPAAGAQRPVRVPADNHGPHYFETPSHNIGCFISAHDARCDIRQRSWSPPPEPRSCIKVGLDYGQGIAVGPNGAEFVCAGDTSLGGPVILPYRASAQRGTILCISRTTGMRCRNTATGHGFLLSRERYRIF